MRNAILVGCLMLLPLLAGCTLVSDLFFDVFHEGYTGGGYSRGDRKSHYDQHREPSEHYHPWSE